MKSLDLHNVLHKDVEREVLQFINWEDPPFKIITGKSHKMREIVQKILQKRDLYWIDENFNNYGCLVVLESNFT
tara:strand:+ start:403 stop:624 length:222 start_codon:yes stop_codon:yes gene_type:complete